MNEVLTDVLAKRRDRAISRILDVKDNQIDPLLPRDGRGRAASQMLRKVVLDQLNESFQLAVEILGSLDTGEQVVLNDHYLKLIASMHDTLADLQQHVLATNGSH